MDRSAALLPEVRGRNAECPLEPQREIELTLESNSVGDLLDSQLRALEQLDRPLQSSAFDESLGRQACYLAKQMCESRGTKQGQRREL